MKRKVCVCVCVVGGGGGGVTLHQCCMRYAGLEWTKVCKYCCSVLPGFVRQSNRE